jgi:site-specific DNA recombinase
LPPRRHRPRCRPWPQPGADISTARSAPARAGDEEAARQIAECDRKLVQYRAALDAGASPATLATWIAEAEAEKAGCQLSTCKPAPRPRMTEAEIRSVIDKLAEVAAVLHGADPDDK